MSDELLLSEKFFTSGEKELIKVVDDILSVNEETVEKVCEEIYNYNKNLLYLVYFVIYAIKIRPLQEPYFVEILKRMNLKYGNKVCKEWTFQHYIDNPTKYNKIESIIINDDVSEFIKYTTSNEFSPDNNKIKRTLLFDEPNAEDVSLMQFAVFFRAVKIYKYIKINGNFDMNDIERYAIAGGQTEILRLMSLNDHTFESCFRIATKFHKHDICSWIIRNFKWDPILANEALNYYNDRVFLFMLHGPYECDQIDINKSIQIAASNGNIEITKYLHDKIHVNCSNLFPYVVSSNDIDFMKFVIDNYHVNVNAFDDKSFTALHIAANRCDLELVKFLVNECHVYLDVLNKDKETALFLSGYRDDLETFEFLISKGANTSIRNVALLDPYEAASEADSEHILGYLNAIIEENKKDLDYSDETDLY